MFISMRITRALDQFLLATVPPLWLPLSCPSNAQEEGAVEAAPRMLEMWMIWTDRPRWRPETQCRDVESHCQLELCSIEHVLKIDGDLGQSWVCRTPSAKSCGWTLVSSMRWSTAKPCLVVGIHLWQCILSIHPELHLAKCLNMERNDWWPSVTWTGDHYG